MAVAIRSNPDRQKAYPRFLTPVSIVGFSRSARARPGVGCAERWVRSVKEACLSKAILFSERSLRRALSEYGRSFPCREESPGEGQHPAVSSGDGPAARGTSEVPRAIGWAAAQLSSRGGVMARWPDQFFGLTGSLSGRVQFFGRPTMPSPGSGQGRAGGFG